MKIKPILFWAIVSRDVKDPAPVKSLYRSRETCRSVVSGMKNRLTLRVAHLKVVELAK
jgi:hypothetical protein